MQRQALFVVVAAVVALGSTGPTSAAAPAPRPLVTVAADVVPGAASSQPADLVVVAGVVYFLANSAPSGQRRLWAWSSGAATPLTEVRADPGACCMGELTVLGARLYFADERDEHGVEMWQYDVASGTTTLVADHVPGPGGSDPSELTAAGGKLYFVSRSSELVEVDPAAAGGVGAVRSVALLDASTHTPVAVGDTLYLVGRPLGSETARELLAFDTTSGALRPVSELGGGLLEVLGAVDGRVYLRVDQPGLGVEPWVYDPATGATTLLADVSPGPADSFPLEVVGLDGRLYFSADGPADRRELWRADPATGRAEQVADLAPGPLAGSEPRELTVADGRLYFQAHARPPALGAQTDTELWVFDPAAAGGHGAVSMVEELRTAPPEREGSTPADLVSYSGGLVFAAVDDDLGTELYRYRSRPQELAAVLFDGEQVAAPGAVVITAYLRNTAATAVSGRLRLQVTSPDGLVVRRTVRADQTVPAHGTVVLEVRVAVPAGALTGRYDGVLALIRDERTTVAAGTFMYRVEAA